MRINLHINILIIQLAVDYINSSDGVCNYCGHKANLSGQHEYHLWTLDKETCKSQDYVLIVRIVKRCLLEKGNLLKRLISGHYLC